LETLTYCSSYLAFIGISKETKFEQEKPLVDYNIQIFQDTLAKVFARGRGGGGGFRGCYE